MSKRSASRGDLSFFWGVFDKVVGHWKIDSSQCILRLMTIDRLEPLTRSHDTGPLSDTTMITVRVTRDSRHWFILADFRCTITSLLCRTSWGSRNRVTEDYRRAFFNSAGEYIAIFVTMSSLTVALSPDIALMCISYLNFNHVKRCRLSSLPQSRVPLSVHKTLVFEGSAATLVVDAPLGGILSCVSPSCRLLFCTV